MIHWHCVYDLDGTLMHGTEALDAAVDAVNELVSEGHIVSILTNDATTPTAERYGECVRCGFRVEPDRFFTPWRVFELNRSCFVQPVMGFGLREGGFETPDLSNVRSGEFTVLIGDVRTMNSTEQDALIKCLEHAPLVFCLNKKLLFRSTDHIAFDAGLEILGIEAGYNIRIPPLGKPCPLAYETVLRGVAHPKTVTAFISDTVDPDLLGAEQVGLTPILYDPSGFIEEAECGLKQYSTMQSHCDIRYLLGLAT